MPRQLPLKLAQSLRYSSDSFILHHGAQSVVDGVLRLAATGRFSVLYVRGEPCSGKTHVAVYLAGRLQDASFPVRFLAASQVAEWCVEDLPREPIRDREVLIIDDADTFLASEVRSGVFAELLERLRAKRGTLFLLGAKSLSEIQTGKENLSHLEAAVSLELDHPEDSVRAALLGAILQQRGRRLPAAKRAQALRQEPHTVSTLVRFVDALEAR
ncbi:MAG: Bacterial dnaA protein [Pseudomonadota bacterium]|jgi:chromosomal replication initiation ATPase DnaA